MGCWLTPQSWTRVNGHLESKANQGRRSGGDEGGFMGTHYRRDNRSQDVALLIDDVALGLESKGLWRRAATRWQQVLLRTQDVHVAEAILQRQRHCLARISAARRHPSDGTAPAGVTLVARQGVPNGPDLWRME